MLQKLQIENFGPIRRAAVEFGDLTVLVGPQATGKSIFLQLLQLVVDTGYVHDEMRKHGLDWKRNVADFLRVYFGEGMEGLWTPGEAGSSLSVGGEAARFADYVSPRHRTKTNHLFYIPAQRVLTLSNGWPRHFSAYGAGDPFAVRDFSERFRLLMEQEFGPGEDLFPRPNRLKREYRDLLAAHVFGGFSLRLDTHGAQKRLVLRQGSAGKDIPFMVWSAGQREFVPLLLGMYWLMPPAKVSRRDSLKWVVIEEPEMGLHPRATSVVLLLLLELLRRDYRVCISTHSPHVLDVVWALKTIREHHAPPERILDIFEAQKTSVMKQLAESVYQKSTRVFFFDRDTGSTREISNLDPASEDEIEAGWGGLTSFSGRVGEVVSNVINAAGR